MTKLYFDEFFSLHSYSTIDNGLTYPFLEYERVRMNLIFGPVIDVLPTHSREEDTIGFHAKRQAWLVPQVKEVGWFLIGRVDRVVDPLVSHWLRFSDDLKSALQAVLLQDDPQDKFPFEEGQVVTMQLVVRNIRRTSSPHTGATWGAVLSPAGESLNGIILANVEVASQ